MLFDGNHGGSGAVLKFFNGFDDSGFVRHGESCFGVVFIDWLNECIVEERDGSSVEMREKISKGEGRSSE